MTNVQKSIQKYIDQMCLGENVKTELVGDCQVKVTENGGRVTLTMNIYGDIMDVETRKILAESDLPHDLMRIGYGEMPHSWHEVQRYEPVHT